MTDHNLLPWRDLNRLKKNRRVSVYCILGLLLGCWIIFFLSQHVRRLFTEQVEQNLRLEQEIATLKVQQLKMATRKQRESSTINPMLRMKQSAEQDSPLVSDFLQINYAKAHDLADMLKDSKTTLISSRGALIVDQRTNAIWVQDSIENMHKIKAWVKHLDVPSQQVVIEARIVNMTKECANDLGVRFGLSKLTPGVYAPRNEETPTDEEGAPIAQGLNVDLAAVPLDASPATIGVALTTLGAHVLLDLELSALESEGRAEVIASPRLITTNQEPAVIESGEDIPYQEYTASGATSVAFKKAVLSLRVIPQITADGKLIMALLITQGSDSGRRVQGVPIISTQSIETTALVNNGQTIVLGGIYKQDKNNHLQKVPFLGNLPIVGHLFTRKQRRVRNEELLIFITPKIIRNNHFEKNS